MRILIADDDPVVRLFVKNVIEHQGHEVLETSDGSQAWALYQERAVDVAVIDWEMPELTGLEDPGKGPRRARVMAVGVARLAEVRVDRVELSPTDDEVRRR